MLQRSHIRHLVVIGLTVALTTHLWMLHDHMPSGATVEVAAAADTPAEILLAAPGPMTGAEAPDMPFMALTCLAVLMVFAAAAGPGARSRHHRVARDTVRIDADGRLVHVLGWPPPDAM